jgi:hypothetical protein
LRTRTLLAEALERRVVLAPPAARGRDAVDLARTFGGSGSRQMGQFWTNRLWRQNDGTAR